MLQIKDETYINYEDYEGVRYLTEDNGDVTTIIPIKGFSSYYADIESGHIYSSVSERWMYAKPNRLGHRYVTIQDEYGNGVTRSVHSLIMQAYLDVESQEEWQQYNMQIYFRDKNRENCSIFNLILSDKKPVLHEPVEVPEPVAEPIVEGKVDLEQITFKHINEQLASMHERHDAFMERHDEQMSVLNEIVESVAKMNAERESREITITY